jgi:hypothetical protein
MVPESVNQIKRKKEQINDNFTAIGIVEREK